ncbi:MAG: RluA family pseudouridine synthase, partial [Gemmatimonadetes bacterium]|nr:RluA family pseudouridine synthase [Gemmatimonadota bacterium]
TRIDVFLPARLEGLSRAIIRREIEAKRLLVNGRPVRKSYPVQAGDRIPLAWYHALRQATILPDPEGELVVIEETPRMIAFNKQPGLPTLPKTHRDTNALACRIVARYPALAAVGGPLEGGLVHRLDTATSGVILAARTPDDYEDLRLLWRLHRVKKEYVAILDGNLVRSLNIRKGMAHQSGKRMKIDANGLAAQTFVTPIARAKNERRTLARVEIREGRRHQIRLHTADAEHPVSGDTIYGGGEETDRLLLHAIALTLTVPGDEERFFFADPPADFLHFTEKWFGGDGLDAITKLRSPSEK